MRRLFLLLTCFTFILGCDDGDIIVSDFDFDEDSSLNRCTFPNNRNVLHLITENNEAVSFTFQANILENIENIIEPEIFSVSISNSNRVNFRRLSANADSNEYFCQDIPPSRPAVTEEFVSTSGGRIEFTITRVTGENVDTDGDGIPDNQERQIDENGEFFGSVFQLDTDGDGIPNFLDIDDDGDNVPTITENTENLDFNRVRENGIIDTDGDGIPNYLDEDDDGDGVITRYEDLNQDLNPENVDSNGNGIPNYLDPSVSESVVVDQFRPNVVSREFNIIATFVNVTLENQETGRRIRLNNQGFGVFRFSTNNETLDFR